jgi:hypothetical protein
MPGMDLIVWLLIVAAVTTVWSILGTRRGNHGPVRREHPRDITPLLHYKIGRRYRND